MSSSVVYLIGHVYKKQLIYVVALDKEMLEKEVQHSLIFRFQGSQLNHFIVESEVVGISFYEDTGAGRTGVIICSNGTAKIVNAQSTWWENISTKIQTPSSRTSLLGARMIGNKIYTIGMLRQVYCRDLITGTWSTVGNNIKPIKGESVAVGFEDIDGFSEQEIYTVGLKGEIWLFNGSLWRKIDSPTNLNLSSVCCNTQDGFVYATGDTGAILRGRHDSWNHIQTDIQSSFTSIAWAFDSIYLSENGNGLYKLTNGFLSKVDFGMDQPVSTYHLHSNDGVLLSVGERDVMLFDGTHWTRLQDP